MNPDPFALRRKLFLEEIGDGVAVIPAGTGQRRNHDVEYPFRQSSDFFYLTGFPEPDAVAVFNPGHPTDRYVLFVRPKDREREIWDGRRAGVEGALSDYGADAAYPLEELDRKLGRALVDRTAVFYEIGNPGWDARIVKLLEAAGHEQSRYGWEVPRRIENPAPILHEMRLHKTGPELERLRRACEISAAGHMEAMRYAAPGVWEYQVQAALEYVFRVKGSERLGYPSIVGSGPNACVLHYTENHRQIEDGDLVLIDAGAEYDFYSADITRTFPANGQFTSPQRALYEVVLVAQEAALALALPGATLVEQHEEARRVMASGLSDLGLVPGSGEDAYEMGFDREFFMHGTGHWLGMDVHDAGRYRFDRRPRPLEPGMAFTIEPGLYIDPQRPTVAFAQLELNEEAQRELAYAEGPAEARKQREEAKEAAPKIEHEVPAEFLGIGVRIEDDVVITETGHENLTSQVPKSIEEVEALCAEAPALPRE